MNPAQIRSQTSGMARLAAPALLLVVFLIGFTIRLYDLTDEPLDFHLARQLRSAVISRSVYYSLRPGENPALRQKALELAAGLESYEPPILETLVGVTEALASKEKPWIARIYLALFWLLGGAILAVMGKRHFPIWALTVSLLFYFFLPFGIIASRAFLPDSWMVFWIMLAVFGLVRWTETHTWSWALAAGLLGGTAVVIKAVAGFFVAGIFTLVVLENLGLKFWRNRQVWAMAALTAALPVVMYGLGDSGRSSDFLSFWTVSLSGLITTTNFYADWLAMIKGLMGLDILVLGLLGVILSPAKWRALSAGAWLGYFLYGLVFPYQYTTHEYYHLPLIMVVALSLPALVDAGVQALGKQNMIWRLAAAGVIGFASIYSLYVGRSILAARDYRQEAAAWAKIGSAIPEDARFIALTADYGMRLRYYGWRGMTAGWPSSSDLHLFSLAGNDDLNVENYFQEFAAGQDLFVVTAFQELEAQPQLREILEARYPLRAEGDGYRIFDLRSGTGE